MAVCNSFLALLDSRRESKSHMMIAHIVVPLHADDMAALVDPTTAAMMGAAQQATAPYVHAKKFSAAILHRIAHVSFYYYLFHRGQDMSAVFSAERENLELVQHSWIGNKVEERLLAMKL